MSAVLTEVVPFKYPVPTKFLSPPLTSTLLSVTKALLAAAVPAVRPSRYAISADVMVVLSIVKLVSQVRVPSKSEFPVTFKTPGIATTEAAPAPIVTSTSPSVVEPVKAKPTVFVPSFSAT